MHNPHIHCLRPVIMLACMFVFLVPEPAMMHGSALKPRAQEFVITAYYSPLPEQCCYVRGSEGADKILNGHGAEGADRTPVYPGMAAAPASYPFGTRMVLPGIGTVTVHDRGGAIREFDDGHRLDLWMGYGEEGLARALAFGVQRVSGIVYPPGTQQPSERFTFETLDAPVDRLQPYLTLDFGLLDARPQAGQRGLSIILLQEHLALLGYFQHAVTGTFGTVTQRSLQHFLREMAPGEPSDRLTERAAAFLIAAARRKDARMPVPFIDANSSAADIVSAQRLLRSLGLYHGRTDGRYAPTLRDAVIAFQRQQGLVGSVNNPGAGRIGPLTRARLELLWRRKTTTRHAEKLLLLKRTALLLAQQGQLPTTFLASGQTGNSVRAWQQFLAERGWFPEEKINGVFGPLTREATIRYQLDSGLIRSTVDHGAGIVGSRTLHRVRMEAIRKAYRMVRSYGWQAL